MYSRDRRTILGYCSRIVFVFPYDALCGLFWWDCALRVYRISYLGYHVSTQGVDERMINVHNYYHYILIIYIYYYHHYYIYKTRKITYL